eukprot:7570312-Pyramimonas_sp.AAC.1
MGDYVVNFSGGASPRHSRGLVDFAEGLKVRRDIHGSTFKQLANLPLKQCPKFATAIVKTMLVRPESYVRDGCSALLTGAELKDITKPGAKAAVTKAEDTFTKAADWLANIPGITNAMANKLRSELE